MARPNIARLADAFVAIGGRIMVNPDGAVETAVDFLALYGRDVPESVAEARRNTTRAIVNAKGASVARLARLVHRNGTPHPSGWQVWGGAR